MASVLDNLKKISPGPKRFAAVDYDRLQLRVVHAERVGGRTRILKLAAVAMSIRRTRRPSAGCWRRR